MPLAMSNLMIIDPSNDKPSRVGYEVKGSKKIRVTKLSNRDLSAKQEQHA